MQCRICDRDADESGYCRFHHEARENLEKKYDAWRKATEISWKEYLSEIVKNPLTGDWARQIAQHLAEDGEKKECRERSKER